MDPFIGFLFDIDFQLDTDLLKWIAKIEFDHCLVENNENQCLAFRHAIVSLDATFKKDESVQMHTEFCEKHENENFKKSHSISFGETIFSGNIKQQQN